jgi:hypothetical protein
MCLRRIADLGSRVKVRFADAYSVRDWTVWFSLIDGSDGVVHVCIDGFAGSPTQHRLFEGARHPRKPGAALVELGSEEEGIVIPLVSTWLDSAEPRQLGLTEYGWERIRDAVTRLGEPSGDSLD